MIAGALKGKEDFMKHGKLLTALFVSSAGGLLAIAGASSAATDTDRSPVAAFFDLSSGVHRIASPLVTLVEPPLDSNADGFYETVVKVNLDPLSGFTKLYAVLDYDGVPTGFTINIGDSATNNGGGGDAATQERDSEMQIEEQLLTVFASDMGRGVPISRTVKGIADSALKVTVANMFLGTGGVHSELDFSQCPPGADLLFALAGQPDSEGPVNYDIYVGMNRVIFGAPDNGRIGAGLARVSLRLE